MSFTNVPGTVFDSNGKTVAEATVSATNTETSKVVSTATSESNGSFLIIVSTGTTYQFTASKSGETGLKVKLDNDTNQDSLSLSIGFTAVEASF